MYACECSAVIDRSDTFKKPKWSYKAKKKNNLRSIILFFKIRASPGLFFLSDIFPDISDF